MCTRCTRLATAARAFVDRLLTGRRRTIRDTPRPGRPAIPTHEDGFCWGLVCTKVPSPNPVETTRPVPYPCFDDALLSYIRDIANFGFRFFSISKRVTAAEPTVRASKNRNVSAANHSPDRFETRRDTPDHFGSSSIGLSKTRSFVGNRDPIYGY